MFEEGSSSLGTTTEGADMSTIIPTQEYSVVLGEKIERTLTYPSQTLPLFLIDSEGMGIKGEEFDFVVTSPPAIVAKAVMFVSSENLQTDVILHDIENYLKGLDHVILEEGQKPGECDTPRYGYFIIVINKLMDGSVTDEEILYELMHIENEAIPGATERNDIRRQMIQCFTTVSAHGLPYLTLQEGQEFGYEVLDDRFRDSLAAIAETILNSTLTPRYVPVAGTPVEFNSTNGETVMATVIDESNEGQIDFTGCGAYWSYVATDVDTALRKASRDLDEIQCIDASGDGLQCSECVCGFRNSYVQETVNAENTKLSFAEDFATLNECGEGAHDQVQSIRQEYINPWERDNSCSEVGPVKSPNICDSTEMADEFNKPGEEIYIFCETLFFCKETILEGLDFVINSNK